MNVIYELFCLSELHAAEKNNDLGNSQHNNKRDCSTVEVYCAERVLLHVRIKINNNDNINNNNNNNSFGTAVGVLVYRLVDPGIYEDIQ